MANRRQVNANRRTAPKPMPTVSSVPAIPPAPKKPAWQQLQERGIMGQGSAAGNKAALADAQASDPLMYAMQSAKVGPDAESLAKGGAIGQPNFGPPGAPGAAGGAPGMTDAQRAGMAQNIGPLPQAMPPGQPNFGPPGTPPMERGLPPGAAEMATRPMDPSMFSTPSGPGVFQGPAGGMGLPPQIMQRLQALRGQQPPPTGGPMPGGPQQRSFADFWGRGGAGMAGNLTPY